MDFIHAFVEFVFLEIGKFITIFKNILAKNLSLKIDEKIDYGEATLTPFKRVVGHSVPHIKYRWIKTRNAGHNYSQRSRSSQSSLVAHIPFLIINIVLIFTYFSIP